MKNGTEMDCIVVFENSFSLTVLQSSFSVVCNICDTVEPWELELGSLKFPTNSNNRAHLPWQAKLDGWLYTMAYGQR